MRTKLNIFRTLSTASAAGSGGEARLSSPSTQAAESPLVRPTTTSPAPVGATQTQQVAYYPHRATPQAAAGGASNQSKSGSSAQGAKPEAFIAGK